MEHEFKYPGMSGICSIDIIFLEFHLVLTKTKTITDIVSDNRPWQTREKLQCLYENLMSNNFRRMADLKNYQL